MDPDHFLAYRHGEQKLETKCSHWRPQGLAGSLVPPPHPQVESQRVHDSSNSPLLPTDHSLACVAYHRLGISSSPCLQSVAAGGSG